MNIKTLILLSALSISGFSVYAQQNFVPANIIPFTVDTIHGYVNDREWRKTLNVLSLEVPLQACQLITPLLPLKDLQYLTETVI